MPGGWGPIRGDQVGAVSRRRKSRRRSARARAVGASTLVGARSHAVRKPEHSARAVGAGRRRRGSFAAAIGSSAQNIIDMPAIGRRPSANRAARRIMFRMAVRRKSWGIRPGQPAATVATCQAFVYATIRRGAFGPPRRLASSPKEHVGEKCGRPFSAGGARRVAVRGARTSRR